MDSTLAGASFDTAWTRIRATYYDSTFGGLDWNNVRRRLRPAAVASRTPVELRASIQAMLDELHDSHFALIPAEIATTWSRDESSALEPGDLGIEFRLIDDHALVTRVARTSPAEAAGVRPGWALEQLDGVEMAALLKRRDALPTAKERDAAEQQIPMKLMATSMGAAGSTATLRLRTSTGEERTLELVRRPWMGEVVQFGLLPPQFFTFEKERLVDARGCVGVMRFSSWMTPLLPHVARAMEDLASCRGIVIDLRGNVGGVGSLVMGLSGYFLDKEHTLGTLISRKTTLRFYSNPRHFNARGEPVPIYAGALAILVDRMSISTSEIFAAAMQDLGRARVFGDSTPGQALPATLAKLPSGDVMMHVIADFRSAGGGRLEGKGVAPDEHVPLRRSDLVAGNDAQLQAALRWISAKKPSTAPTAAMARPIP
jgi:carboxyl-terminal processing protease